MMAIRTLGWSALVLVAFAGCAKEPEPTTTPPSDTAPASTSTSPSPATIPPPATPPADVKPEGDKGTTPGGATDMPKIEAPQPTPATKDAEKKPEDKAAAASVSLTGEEVAEVKKLPAGEAERALKQLVCPVSGENLGSMGMPVKVTAAGQTFFLCCKGCSKDVTDDPAAVVAKLKK